jgi:Right handed beta helix region
MIRIIAKLFAVTVALAVCLPVQPSSAGSIVYVSATGGGTACTQTAPCATIDAAIVASLASGGRVVCVTAVQENAATAFPYSGTFVFDCPSASWLGGIGVSGSGVLKFQHISFSGFGTLASMIRVTGSGTVIFEDCVIEDVAGTALDIEPNAPFNLFVTNSRISNSTAGVLLKPAAGGSVTATFNGVTIVNNTGGGLKTDATNGPISVNISNSTISNNSGNGMNAIGNTIYSNMLNLSHNVIAKNGSAGIQANGTLAAAVVDTTLLDTNVAGATSAVNGGRVYTYGNNRLLGSPGSGFFSTLPMQ